MRVCVCVGVRAACEIDFSIYKKKIKIYLYFRLLRGHPLSHPPPARVEYYFCFCCQKHNLCFIYDSRFPLAFNFLLFASFDGFLVRVFIETCLIYTQRHLGTHSETPRKRTRTPRCGHTQRTVPGLGQRVFTYAQSRSQFDTIAIPTRIRIRIQIQIQRVIMSIIISAVRHNWRAAFTAYFSGFFCFLDLFTHDFK